MELPSFKRDFALENVPQSQIDNRKVIIVRVQSPVHKLLANT